MVFSTKCNQFRSWDVSYRPILRFFQLLQCSHPSPEVLVEVQEVFGLCESLEDTVVVNPVQLALT